MKKFVVLCLALLLLLCACAPAEAPELSPGPSASESAAPSETPEVSESPAETQDYGFSEIEQALRDFVGYDECYVMAAHDAGPYTLVQYTGRYLSEEALAENDLVDSNFAWFDRENGTFHHALSYPVYVQDFHLSETGELLVLTTGQDVSSGRQYFPYILRANNAQNDEGPVTEPYYMPLDQSLTIGTGKPETLLELRWEEDALHMVFGPQEGAETIGNYVAAVETIPIMELTAEGGEAKLRLQDVILGEDLVLPEDEQILAVEEVDGDTWITLDCGEATRYNMGGDPDAEETEPQTITVSWEDADGSHTEELPLVDIRLQFADESVAADYPEAW